MAQGDGSQSPETPPVIVVNRDTVKPLVDTEGARNDVVDGMASKFVGSLNDDQKLAIQREALNTGFTQVQDTAKSTRETDQAYMAGLAQPATATEVPQKFSIWKPSTWFK